MKKIMILLMAIGFISGCSCGCFDKTKNRNISSKITTKYCKLQPFRSIVVAGNTQVKLISGVNTIKIKGVGADEYDCQSGVKDNVLYVNSFEDNFTVVEISAKELNSITVIDRAEVNAKKIKSYGLVVIAKDHGTINLEGYLDIRKILQFGAGRINIGWLKSKQLSLIGSASGPVYLAGTVGKMVIKLTNDAALNARFLLAKKATVITTDDAHAEVMVLDDLNGFAIDRASIYYYKRPKHLNVVTRNMGNVLFLD